jgi:hypothetical protein
VWDLSFICRLKLIYHECCHCHLLRDKDMVANYITNQRAHHQRESFEDEYRKHLQNAGIEWNDYRLT